ncbi:hypothetical protein JCM17845_12610 [Iodidimonas gelatinilytica]|uniref:Glutaredoxin domain-containing protein n=1 Tax=Iodidimonas gelatinilytica TaxID=1236966 RepID=A0A5A7MXP6_9PROT|nr:hypothetical protein JCM17845_12610 [Iodidimonas gelatinilytica]
MTETTHDRIAHDVKADDVVLFMKGTPVFPQCGFSSVVVQILSHIGVPFKSYDVLSDQTCVRGSRNFPIGRPFPNFM